MFKQRRYPGISPFDEKQKNIFFGRNKDKKKLLRLIKLRKQVLLYSKSGVGKTSLLNAGVLPHLNNDYVIIKIRFFAFNPTDEKIISPMQRIINSLFEISDNLQDKTTVLDKIETEKNLWFWLKKMQIIDTDPKPVLFIFDQFEELFSYPSQMIEEFKTQMQQILHGQPPAEVLAFVEDNPDLDNQTESLYYNPDVKTVYAIRSDRLSLMNRLTDKIPDIQNNFYELLPLTREQAKEAILSPAQADFDFESPKFDFEQQALEKVLNVLTDKHSLTVETTQLQIVCQRIEDIATEKASASGQKTEILIKTSELPEFKDIFLDFYQDALNQIPEAKRSKVAILIEDNLIINGQRITLHEAVCKQFASDDDLKKLTNVHLLRAENTSTGFAYELSHDTLVDPILEVRSIRKEQERQREAERRHQQKLRKLQIQRRRQRTITAIISIAAIISLAFAFFGFSQMNKAQTALKQAIELQADGKKRDAQQFVEQEKYTDAIQKYTDLLQLYRQYPQFDFDSNEVYQSIAECRNLDSISNDFYAYMTAADSLIVSGDLKKIKQGYDYYKKAVSLNYKSKNAEKILETFDLKLQQTKEKLRKQKSTALDAGGLGQTVANSIDDLLEYFEKQ